jgi:hypothetical protein
VLLKKNYKERGYFVYLKSRVTLKNLLKERKERKTRILEGLKNLKS